MASEKVSHMCEREAKRGVKLTWERVKTSWDGDEDGNNCIRYTLYDSTTGPTAFHRMMFAKELPRHLIAGEIRRMRSELRQLVRQGPDQ